MELPLAIGHAFGRRAADLATDARRRDWRCLGDRLARGRVRCFRVLLWWGGCGFELLIDLAGAFAGGGEFGGLGERFAEAGGGVVDLAAGVLDLGREPSPCSLSRLGEPVFQPGDQADRVGVGEFPGRECHLGAGGAVEGWGHADLAEGAGDSDGQWEAAQFPGANGALPGTQLVRCLLPEHVEQVQARV